MGLLSPGVQSTEWKVAKAGMVIGVLLLVSDKVNISALTPDSITNMATTLKANTDEYLGAIMVLVSAVSYMGKRAFLKYHQMKQQASIEIEKMKADLAALQQQVSETKPQSPDVIIE